MVSDQTLRYLDLLTGSPQGPTMWAWKDDRTSGGEGMQVKVGTLDDMSGVLADKQLKGCGIFSLVNRSRVPDRRRKADIASVRAIWMDVDGVSDMPTLPLDPTMVVRTRNGFHIYYVLQQLSDNIAWCEGMNRALCQKYGGDSAAVDASRVLRVPGFYHHKSEPYLVYMFEDSGTRYTVQELEDALGAPTMRQEASLHGVGNTVLADSQDSFYGLRAASGEVSTMCAAQVGERNRTLNRSCFKLGQLVAGGELTMGSALDAARRGADGMGYSADHSDAEKVIAAGIRSGMGSPRSAAPAGQVVSTAPTCGVVANRDALEGRIAAEIDRRIKMGFSPAPGPLRELNRRLGGGAPAGAVTLIGAPPGMGKSSLALDWAYGYAKTGKPALYCSLELSELDLYARLTTLSRSLSWIEVRCGQHREELLDTVRESLHAPFFAATRAEMTKVEELPVFIDQLSQKYGHPPLVVIDYLQLLMPAGETREQWAVMSDISGEVAHCAQDSGSPIICITAVNRQSYNITDKATGKPDQMMALAAAKQSGRLEYDAEAILGLQLFEASEAGVQYGWIIIAKNRSGGSSGSIGVQYDGLSGKFSDAEQSDVFGAIDNEKRRMQSSKGEDVKERIVGALRMKRFRSKDDLFKVAKVGRPTGSQALIDLIDERRVIKNIVGEYALVTAEESNYKGED